MKQCSKCKEGKDESEFNKHIRKKDGLSSSCRECDREKNRKYHVENKEKKNNDLKKGKQENHQKYKKLKKLNRESPVKITSKTKRKLEIYEEIRESINGNIEVKCTYCGKWFEPKRKSIETRLKGISGKTSLGTECRLYCSVKCKENCPSYHQILHPKDQKPATSREVQPELRQLVFKRDNYTCQRCGYHKDKLEIGIHCHHMEGVQGNPIESTDEDICITLCENCHKEVHDQPGCRYHELRCNK